MRKTFLLVWLMLPVAAAAYHYGPGQDRMILDDVAGLLSEADACAAKEQWLEAEQKYAEALNLLPDEERSAIQRVRLERAKAQMFVKKLPVAHRDLQGLVDELKSDADADPMLLEEARAAFANSQYYMTWLMRLEGRTKDDWEPEIESSRQIYRLLAEQSEERGDPTAAKKHREDLESSIRLARMALTDLQGLPLPSQ